MLLMYSSKSLESTSLSFIKMLKLKIILEDPKIFLFYWEANFISSFKNPVLNTSGKVEEKKKKRQETLEHLFEEMVELVW